MKTKLRYLFEPKPNRMYISRNNERFVVVDLVHDGFVYFHYCVGGKCNIVHLNEFNKEYRLLKTNAEKRFDRWYYMVLSVFWLSISVISLIAAITVQ